MSHPRGPAANPSLRWWLRHLGDPYGAVPFAGRLAGSVGVRNTFDSCVPPCAQPSVCSISASCVTSARAARPLAANVPPVRFARVLVGARRAACRPGGPFERSALWLSAARCVDAVPYQAPNPVVERAINGDDACALRQFGEAVACRSPITLGRLRCPACIFNSGTALTLKTATSFGTRTMLTAWLSIKRCVCRALPLLIRNLPQQRP